MLINNAKALISLIFVLFNFSCTSDVYTRVAGNPLYLSNGTQELFWFDGIHCSDPSHRMFRDIENEFDKFVPDCVLVEGGNNIDSSDGENAILNGGEPRYVAYLGYRHNVPVFDIEPSDEQQFRFLLSKYEAGEILAMYLIRQIYQLHRELKDDPRNKVDFYRYFIGFINQMKLNGFPIDDVSPQTIDNSLRPYFSLKITEDNWYSLDVGSIIYFNRTPNRIHDIWKDVTNYRDDHCVSLIEDLSKKYNRIFVMMGGDHIRAQKDRLAKIYTKTE